MVLISVLDFQNGGKSAIFSNEPEPITETADYLAANWRNPACEGELLALAEQWGSRLLVPEVWREVLPQAGLLISSAISGGNLRQRFREAAKRPCWLLTEPMKTAFPLPCPSGQGVPVLDLPKRQSFYSEALGCRYLHDPEQVILFDTEETMEKKIELARECGFAGVIA